MLPETGSEDSEGVLRLVSHQVRSKPPVPHHGTLQHLHCFCPRPLFTLPLGSHALTPLSLLGEPRHLSLEASEPAPSPLLMHSETMLPGCALGTFISHLVVVYLVGFCPPYGSTLWAGIDSH